jgi:hypothetical protein
LAPADVPPLPQIEVFAYGICRWSIRWVCLQSRAGTENRRRLPDLLPNHPEGRLSQEGAPLFTSNGIQSMSASGIIRLADTLKPHAGQWCRFIAPGPARTSTEVIAA